MFLSILINKVFFSLASLCASASERAVVHSLHFGVPAIAVGLSAVSLPALIPPRFQSPASFPVSVPETCFRQAFKGCRSNP